MKLPVPSLGRSIGAAQGGSRTGLSLLACAAVLALVFGVAELRPPAAPPPRRPGSRWAPRWSGPRWSARSRSRG